MNWIDALAISAFSGWIGVAAIIVARTVHHTVKHHPELTMWGSWRKVIWLALHWPKPVLVVTLLVALHWLLRNE